MALNQNFASSSEHKGDQSNNHTETAIYTTPQTVLTKLVVLDSRVLRSELKEIVMQTDNRNPFPCPGVSINSESDMGQGC